MSTQFIGMKEFRQNIAGFTKKAKQYNIRFIILKKNKPVLEIRSIGDKEVTLEKLVAEIKEARQQVKRGEVHTQEEIMKEFGLL